MTSKQQLSDSDYPLPETLRAARCVFKGVRFDVCSLNIKVDETHTIRDGKSIATLLHYPLFKS